MMAVVVERRPTRIADRIQAWVFGCPLWILAAVAITIPAILYGIHGTYGVDVLAHIAPDPMRPFYPEHYLMGSPLGFWLQWALRITSTPAYVAMHLVMLIAAVVGSTLMLRRYWSDTAARYGLMAWVCSPLSAIETTALGQPDASTLFATAAIIAGPTGWCLVGGVLLGFNHFEQGVFIVAFVLVLRWHVAGRWERSGFATLAGMAAGKALLEWYHHAAGVEIDGRLEMARDLVAWDSVSGFSDVALAATWSVYGTIWVAVIWAVRQEAWRFLVLTFVALPPVIVTLDTTRVWALLTWPVVLALCYWVTQRDSVQVRRVALCLVLLACVIPRANVWSGGAFIAGR